MRKSLSRVERLRSKADFARVFRDPDKKSACSGAKLVAKRNSEGSNRFAATAVRNFGNAVQRNYARRVLKEIYRKSKNNLPSGYDIVVVLYPGDFSYRDRERQFTRLVRRAQFAERNS